MVWVLLLLCSLSTAQAGTWWDNFEDGNLQEWEIFNFVPRVEAWTIKNGEAIGEIFELGSMSLLVAGDSTWHDYRVLCRAKFDKAVDDDGSLGISIHESDDADSRYVFFLNIGIGLMRIWRVEEGDWGVPVAIPFEAEMDTWYELEAVVQDEQLAFRVNDKILPAVSREALPAGKFALVVSNARAHFDDVSVEGDNIPNYGPAGFAVKPQSKLSTLWGGLKRSP